MSSKYMLLTKDPPKWPGALTIAEKWIPREYSQDREKCIYLISKVILSEIEKGICFITIRMVQLDNDGVMIVLGDFKYYNEGGNK